MTEKERELLANMQADIAVIKQAIIGNGTTGLHDRMTDIEKWAKKRPKVCPLDDEMVDRKQRRRIALVGVGLAVLTIGVNIGMKLWR